MESFGFEIDTGVLSGYGVLWKGQGSVFVSSNNEWKL
jgi:hypothetical protein